MWLVFVDTFDGTDPQAWADQTFTATSLGVDDYLLAVAMGDRQYGYVVDQGFALDDAALARVATAAERHLAENPARPSPRQPARSARNSPGLRQAPGDPTAPCPAGFLPPCSEASPCSSSRSVSVECGMGCPSLPRACARCATRWHQADADQETPGPAAYGARLPLRHKQPRQDHGGRARQPRGADRASSPPASRVASEGGSGGNAGPRVPVHRPGVEHPAVGTPPRADA